MSIYSVASNDLQRASASVASSLSPATAKPAAATASSSDTSTSASTQDITSDDFLTLLVTEMKNQDPTQPTDPNAYIQQLTEVNSLQQLISINQDLSGSGTGSSGSSVTTQPITS